MNLQKTALALCTPLFFISESAADTSVGSTQSAKPPSVEVARDYELQLEKLDIESLLERAEQVTSSYEQLRSEIGTEPARARLWSLRTQLVTKCVPANIAADEDEATEDTLEMLNGESKNLEQLEERCEEARREVDNVIQSTERVSK